MCELLVAVHAVKSSSSVLAHFAAHPAQRRVVLLAGTDVYPTFQPTTSTLAALRAADAIVTLQPLAQQVLDAELRCKARTIVQSATAVAGERPKDRFAVAVLAHLRAIKAPLLPFQALAHVPKQLALEVTLAGKVLEPELGHAALHWQQREARAKFVGELSRQAARRMLASSHLLVVPSHAEGGANVVSEALAAGTPVLATAVPGNIGLLGADWPGLFPPNDAAALGALFSALASDSTHYQELVARTRVLQNLVDPRHELAAWNALLQDLALVR